MAEEIETGSAQRFKAPTPDAPTGMSPAFKKAVGRFFASHAQTSEPKQYKETPEVNSIEKYNNYTHMLASFVRHRFLPSQPSPNEQDERKKTQKEYVPKEERGLGTKLADRVRNLALRNIPSDAFHAISRVTAPSESQSVVRSLATRAVRARLYRELESIPKENIEGRKRVLAEAHARDRIARDFLNQAELTVNLDSLGEQMAKYVTLEPPNTQHAQKVPILFIPGISNDLDSVAGLAQEAAYSGRKITTVTFPDATIGRVTPEFAKATDKSETYQAHTAFYKAAIDKLVPEGNFELWGFSTGGPISAEILNDPKYQNRVTNAVLIGPASVVDQSINKSLMPGLGHEIFGLKSTAERYSFVTGAKEKTTNPEAEKARRDTFAALLKKVTTAMPDLYVGAKVREPGKILIISQAKDDVTKTEKGKDIFLANPQAQVITVPDAYHNTAVTEPERIITKIHQFQTS